MLDTNTARHFGCHKRCHSQCIACAIVSDHVLRLGGELLQGMAASSCFSLKRNRYFQVARLVEHEMLPCGDSYVHRATTPDPGTVSELSIAYTEATATPARVWKIPAIFIRLATSKEAAHAWAEHVQQQACHRDAFAQCN